MIGKFLLLKESPSTTPPLDLNFSLKAHPIADFLPKNTTKKSNQADLSYFDPHLDRAYKEGEIVLVGKNIYYRNVILFRQHL